MENGLSDKTQVVLLKRGGRIWVNNRQADIAKEAKLAGEGVVDIDGQLIDVTEIRAIINADTYQATPERKQERTSETFGLPVEKSNCHVCGGDGFILYNAIARPCERCNTDTPRLSW